MVLILNNFRINKMFHCSLYYPRPMGSPCLLSGIWTPLSRKFDLQCWIVLLRLPNHHPHQFCSSSFKADLSAESRERDQQRPSLLDQGVRLIPHRNFHWNGHSQISCWSPSKMIDWHPILPYQGHCCHGQFHQVSKGFSLSCSNYKFDSATRLTVPLGAPSLDRPLLLTSQAVFC